MAIPRGLLPDVSAVLGCELADLHMDGVRDVVAKAVPEFEQLDWKVTYVANSHGRRELAKDVAAMANGRGGVIVVGVDEDDGRADGLELVEVGDGEERRYQQTIATGTHPRVDVTVASVRSPEDPERGVLLVVVPPTVVGPHAVEAGSRLAYPVRRGTTTDFLREYEVREAYLRRHGLLEDRRGRAVVLAGRALTALRDDHPVRITVAVVPDRPGQAPVSEAWTREIQSRTFPRPTTLDGDVHSHAPTQVILGGVRLRWEQVHDNGLDRLADYHDDGSTGYGRSIGIPRPDGTDQTARFYTGDNRVLLPQPLLVSETTRAVEIAAGHAADAGTFGTATAVVLIEAGRDVNGVTLKGRGAFGAETTRDPVIAPYEELAVTIELPGDDGAALVQAARRVLTPVMQLHGVAEVPLLNEDGTVTPLGPDSNVEALTQWARSRGVDVRQ